MVKILMLVLAGSDFDPPETIGSDTEEWVRRARADAGRDVGGRIQPPADAIVLGPTATGEVEPTPGPRVDDDEQIVGFDVLDCPSMDRAVELVRAHPMARVGRIELRAVADDVPE